MSDTEKRPYAHMLKVACGLVQRLRPACHRIEIAGSIRRKALLCSDIEIVAVPILHTNLFDEPLETSKVDDLLAEWSLQVTVTKNGAKYKQFMFMGKRGGWYKVDLFLQPDPATWGVNFLIRTGSSDFAHRMVTPRWQGGYMPDIYKVQGARVWENGVALPTPEEDDVFALWNMEFVPPENRELSQDTISNVQLADTAEIPF